MARSTVSFRTAIRTAFDNIQVKKVVDRNEAGRIAGIVHDKLQGNAGVVQVPGWNAKLTFDTYKALKAEGIMV